MYRKYQPNRSKLQNQFSFTSVNTPTYAQKSLIPGKLGKLFTDRNRKGQKYGDQKSNHCQSFTRSLTSDIFRKYYVQEEEKSSQSQSSKSTRLNQSVSTNYYCHKYHKLHKQNQELRSQHKLLISHLLETKKTLEGMSRMYTQKCQQTQTLKSIITSLKQYIYKQRSEQIQAQPYTRFVQYKQKDNLKQQAKIKRKISQDKKLKENALRRISINQILMQAPFGINSNDIKAFDSYIRQQCVQSIKGSAYEINSSTEMF